MCAQVQPSEAAGIMYPSAGTHKCRYVRAGEAVTLLKTGRGIASGMPTLSDVFSRALEPVSARSPCDGRR